MILDGELLSGNILKAAKAAIRGGADIIQLRDKRSPVPDVVKMAKALAALCRRHDVPFIVNDHVEAAVAANADGVHIGQGDIGVAAAKKLLGPGKIVGVSATSIAQAKKAKHEGASYIGGGPVFKTPIKQARTAKGIALLEKIKLLGIPMLAIGGIDDRTVLSLTKRGIRSIAVIRAVCAERDKFAATKRLKEALALL